MTETTGQRVAREWAWAELSSDDVHSEELANLAARIDAALATVEVERDAARALLADIRALVGPVVSRHAYLSLEDDGLLARVLAIIDAPKGVTR